MHQLAEELSLNVLTPVLSSSGITVEPGEQFASFKSRVLTSLGEGADNHIVISHH